MFKKIRAVFFKNALGKLLTNQNRQRKIHTLDSAQAIGVLFDATEPNTRKEAIALEKALKKDGTQLQLLGFIHDKKQPEPQDFDFLTLKDSNWIGIPKGEKAEQFMKEKFDLLLSFNPKNRQTIEWLTVGAQASMKIGLATERPNDFDFQLEPPDGKGLLYFAEQLRIYLEKIVLTK